MKKTLIAVLAIAGVVACNKTEVVEVAPSNAIQFDNAFVDNATRAAVDPSTTTESLQKVGFEVYGFMNSAAGVVFNGEDVTYANGKWGYANTQYWTAGNTYYFAALAPIGTKVTIAEGDAAKYGVGTVEFTNKDGKTDLLYAAEMRACENPAAMEVVKFNFNHLLSKVKFSFTNGFANENATITVKNIKMVVPANGTINLAQADWWSTNQWVLGNGTTTLEFGDMETANVKMGATSESANERLTIPADGTAEQVYTVTFDVELYYGTEKAYKASLSTDINWTALEIGKAYNFHAVLNAKNIVPEDGELYPIEFSATVKDWVDGGIYDGKEIVTGTVETPAE